MTNDIDLQFAKTIYNPSNIIEPKLDAESNLANRIMNTTIVLT